MECNELSFIDKNIVLDKMEQYFFNKVLNNEWCLGMCAVACTVIEDVTGNRITGYSLKKIFPEFHKSAPNKAIYWYPIGDPEPRLKHIQKLKQDMSIHTDLELMTRYAVENAFNHKCNYNVILMNPDKDGKFSPIAGSTYECVLDSYFEKERPNVILLFKTDEL